MLWKIYSNLSQFDFSSNLVQKYFKPLIFESKILFKIQKKKEFMLQPPQLSAHFVARPIFVSPALPPKPARTARPFGPVHRLPPPASIGTSTPSAAPPYLAPPTVALLRERTAKPMRRHAVSSSPFNSFETNKEENSTAVGGLPIASPAL
jgi:hypothetical protein